MTTQISTFNFKSNPVRIETINNEPYFCLTDVCSALSINNANSSRFNLNGAGIHKMYISFPSGKKEVTFINEPNLYRIIFRSNKAEAVEFQNWVFEEVLPTIRQTGQYLQNTQQIAPLVDPLQERITREMPVEHLLRFASLWFRLYDCNNVMEQLKTPLQQLGSTHAPRVYSCAVEDKNVLGTLKRILEPMLEGIEVPEHERHYRRALETLRNYQPTGIGKLAII